MGNMHQLQAGGTAIVDTTHVTVKYYYNGSHRARTVYCRALLGKRKAVGGAEAQLSPLIGLSAESREMEEPSWQCQQHSLCSIP